MKFGLKSFAATVFTSPLAVYPSLGTSSESPAPLSFLHAAGTAIADEKNQPVVLCGCNLGNWLLLETWMLGIFDSPNLRDQWGLEQTLTSRLGAQEAAHILDLYRENWINEQASRSSRRGASTSCACRSITASSKTILIRVS